MRPFRFRLDPVLAHRERLERERAGEHARALANQREAERRRDEYLERRDAIRDELAREHRRFDGDRLRVTYAHLGHLDRAIEAAHARVAALAALTEQARMRLVAAARDRKVLETLKDRRRETHELEAAQADQRELDDLNARAYERAHPLEGLPT